MSKIKFVSLFILVLLLDKGAAQAFGTGSRAASAEGCVNGQITREALSHNLCPQNLQIIIDANESQNKTAAATSDLELRKHFASANSAQAIAYADRERLRAINYAHDAVNDPVSRLLALKHFAYVLHSMQDFYSNSNYVELQLENANNLKNPFNIPLIDWTKITDGYVGEKTGNKLLSGYSKTTEDIKAIDGRTTYFDIARELAVKETQRQWNLFERLIRTRFAAQAPAIIEALKNSVPNVKSGDDIEAVDSND